MKLYFLRHGLAGQHGDPQYKDDSLRPLTSQGRKKMLLASRGMRRLGLRFDIILSSPYRRARQTAGIVAGIYKFNKNRVCLTDLLLPPSSVRALLKFIQKRFPQYEDILLVGHEPHLTQMISVLLKCSPALNIELKKGGLCSLVIMAPSPKPAAVLTGLLTSQQLELLSGN